MSEASYAAPHCSPLLALLPEPFPLAPVHGKIVFHETSPWCQKGWRPLLRPSMKLDRVRLESAESFVFFPVDKPMATARPVMPRTGRGFS